MLKAYFLQKLFTFAKLVKLVRFQDQIYLKIFFSQFLIHKALLIFSIITLKLLEEIIHSIAFYF